MTIFAVDDEPLALSVLTNAIKEASPDSTLLTFSTPEELLQEAKKTHCDVAFLDISMRSMTGIELAKELSIINQNINIIFVTAFRDYYGEAWELLASGYVTKPVTAEKLKPQLSNLRHPVKTTENKIKVVTFGNFTVFCNEKPVKFHRAKSQELLAYLVDRKGSVVSRREAGSILFESGDYDHNQQSHMNLIIKELKKDLQEAGALDILADTSSTSLAVDTSKFSCDSYDFLSGKDRSKFHGEYLTQYSWSELQISQFL